MPEPTLGKLEKVDLRRIWPHEERDFTPWLAENIQQLSDLLRLEITVDQTEKGVGSYQLDIFGHSQGRPVIIENQLEATDHTHLGQLLTYAGSLDAAIIIWLAPFVRDEHRRAIEWLNSKTVDEISFFLVRPEAFSINGSPPAVRFNLEVGPNPFVRVVRRETQPENNPWREFVRNLWTSLCPYLVTHGHSWAQSRSATSENYIQSTIGKSGVSVTVGFEKASSRAFVAIWLDSDDAKNHFDRLADNRPTIEAEFPGETLTWERRDDRKNSTVFADRPYEMDKISEASPEREALFSWIDRTVTRFRNIAKKYLVEV